MSRVSAWTDIGALAEQVARGLSKGSVLDGRAFIRTPVLLPSGSTVVVVIEDEGGGRYRLSDIAQGEEEADLAGLATTYRNQAVEVAQLAGLTFDGHAFVLTRARGGELVGATMAIANAVARAVERAWQRADQRQRAPAAERLVSRLDLIFAQGRVEHDVELRGASTHAWKVDAVVHTGHGRAVFDIVTPHPTSVAFATTKFHDLALLDDPPIRVAVVPSKASLHEFLAVVSQAARVIEGDAPDRTYVRAAA